MEVVEMEDDLHLHCRHSAISGSRTIIDGKRSNTELTNSGNVNIKKINKGLILTNNESKLFANKYQHQQENNMTSTEKEMAIKQNRDGEYQDDENDDDKLFVKPKDKDRSVVAGNCYCGKDRNLNIVELLCANCNGWYHESCIGYQLGKSIPFMMNYIFFCKNCSPTGLEIFKKNQATIAQLCIAAIANLQQYSVKEGKCVQLFSRDAEIVPFIDSHWEGMTTNPRRVTQSWHATVSRSLLKETSVFRRVDCNDTNDAKFGLRETDITKIRPNYDAMIKSGHLKITEFGLQLGSSSIKGRSGGKRKTVGAVGEGGSSGGSFSSKRTRVEAAPVKLSAHGYPLEHPFNKDSFRYFLAEPDPHAPFRQEFDESNESAGRPIPGWLYRSLCSNSVLIALHDRAPQLRVTDDRLSISGEKGYCLARATHYVTRGTWYFEVTVKEMPDGSACRIGWGQPYANLQTPLGFDKFGYCWRSRKGTIFHKAIGRHFGNSGGYGERDTLGLMIDLPPPAAKCSGQTMPPLLPTTLKDRPLVKFKSHLYYEEKDNAAELAKNLKSLPDSRITLFKNGQCEGVAFDDIYAGPYYPSFSLFKSCVLSINFGPKFKHPPNKQQYSYKPMCDRAEETICEQTLSDLVFLTENEGQLKLD